MRWVQDAGDVDDTSSASVVLSQNVRRGPMECREILTTLHLPHVSILDSECRMAFLVDAQGGAAARERRSFVRYVHLDVSRAGQDSIVAVGALPARLQIGPVLGCAGVVQKEALRTDQQVLLHAFLFDWLIRLFVLKSFVVCSVQ